MDFSYRFTIDNQELILERCDLAFLNTIDKLPDGTISLYIYADDITIKERLIKRGDNPDEADRRLYNDNIDFINIKQDVDYVVHNTKDDNIDDVIRKIISLIN